MNPFLIFEITTKCTHKCSYCYNVWLDNDEYQRGYLPFNKIKTLFDKLLKEIHPAGIALAGGEPLLHPDILEITNYFNSKEIPVGIASNGFLLNKTMADALIANGAKYFEISIDSLRDQEYLDLTGVNKLSDVKSNILYLKEKQMKITLATIVSKQNLNAIDDIIDLAFGFGIKTVSLNRFVPTGDGNKNRKDLEITSKELELVLQKADKKAQETGISVNATIPVEPCEIPHEQFKKIKFGPCICGKHKWTIDPFGNLRTSEQSPDIIGNLFIKSFEELSHSDLVSTFRNKFRKKECVSCQWLSICGGGCRFLCDIP